MKGVIVTAAILATCAGCSRTSAEECEYDGLAAKCGEIIVQQNKNYRTGELHPMTGDFRDLIAQEGGRILMDDADLGFLVTKFGGDEENLARVLDLVRNHPAVQSADYNLVAVLDDTFRVD